MPISLVLKSKGSIGSNSIDLLKLWTNRRTCDVKHGKVPESLHLLVKDCIACRLTGGRGIYFISVLTFSSVSCIFCIYLLIFDIPAQAKFRLVPIC